MRVLFIVQDSTALKYLQDYLQENFTLSILSYVPSNTYEFDLIIIYSDDLDIIYDIMKIRSNTDTLLITCSKTFNGVDIAKVLDSGADNHVTAPVDTVELEKKIAVLKKLTQKEKTKIVVKDLVLNAKTKQITRNNQEIQVSVYGYKILEYLALSSGRIITGKELCEHLYCSYNKNKVAVLRVHISILRKALQSDPKNRNKNEYITTTTDVGYTIAN